MSSNNQDDFFEYWMDTQRMMVKEFGSMLAIQVARDREFSTRENDPIDDRDQLCAEGSCCETPEGECPYCEAPLCKFHLGAGLHRCDGN